jgi:hypothetical protein
VQGKLSEAQSVVEGAAKTPAQDRGARISFAITSARLKGRTGKIADASRELEGVLKDASGMKLTGYEFEARLAQAEMKFENGNASAARLQLQTLGKEAGAKGFRLIARKAASASAAKGKSA